MFCHVSLNQEKNKNFDSIKDNQKNKDFCLFLEKSKKQTNQKKQRFLIWDAGKSKNQKIKDF